MDSNQSHPTDSAVIPWSMALLADGNHPDNPRDYFLSVDCHKLAFDLDAAVSDAKSVFTDIKEEELRQAAEEASRIAFGQG